MPHQQLNDSLMASGCRTPERRSAFDRFTIKDN
jgi:hypothetical protein